MTDCVRLAIAGAGRIGRRHAEEIDRCSSTELAAVVDPAPAGRRLADEFGVPVFPSLRELFEVSIPDGMILATPNRLHVSGGLDCVRAGVPVLVEKPLADTVSGASALVEAAAAAGVPLLTGHHRQYSPIMSAAYRIVQSGILGPLVSVVGTALFCKPDDYFEDGGVWRREPGGGPILLNLIHEVNSLMRLAGDIVGVQAVSSTAARGFEVEDTAAMIVRFAGGALGTFLLSDTAGSPRSWEQTSGEDKAYVHYDDEDCYHIAGTHGSLSIPTMRVRTYPGRRSWDQPFVDSTVGVAPDDPLAAQIAHFADVLRGDAEPVVTGLDGLKALRVTEAIRESALTGQFVETGLGSASRAS